MTDKDESEVKKAQGSKKSAASRNKAVAKSAVSNKAPDNVTVEDMHELLTILRSALDSRDKSLDHLQQQIAQNQKILAKRGVIYKLGFVLLAIGVLAVGFDQHTIVKSFDKDMTNVSKDMDAMLLEMTAMRKAIESMSNDFSQVSTDVSSIDKSVGSMSHGVRGMSYDTYQMNRSMNTMTPPT